MSANTDKQPGVYKITCDSGCRYAVYNASEIGNPADHVPDKWYFRPYAAPQGDTSGDPFETAEAAERAARAWDGRVNAMPPPPPR